MKGCLQGKQPFLCRIALISVLKFFIDGRLAMNTKHY